MYFKSIEIINQGPIKNIKLDFPFNENGNPKPLMIVGKNGAGKSIFLSHLVNYLISLKSVTYPDDCDVDSKTMYKVRSSSYISSTEAFSFVKMELSENLSLIEWVLKSIKRNFEKDFGFIPSQPKWDEIPENQHNHIIGNHYAYESKIKTFFENNCVLYFPANRFEEPSWLNFDNLSFKPEHTDKIHVQGRTQRKIICHSPLKHISNWLLDLLVDKKLYEEQLVTKRITIEGITETVFIKKGYKGTCTFIYNEANKLLSIITNNKQTCFGIGDRVTRNIAISDNETFFIPSIFQLSTGQTSLLNLFLSILYDHDQYNANLQSLDELMGVVIIDEIDLHLHGNLLYQTLPELISMFPKVQFIVTSHSPLFLLGMEKKFGNEGIEIIELPTGKTIHAEVFSEFGEAYDSYLDTQKFKNQLEKEILETTKPAVILEGDTDLCYLRKAAQLLGKENLLSRIKLFDGKGEPRLRKVWNEQHWSNPDLVNRKILLVFDCDTNIEDDNKGNLIRRMIPKQNNHPIENGIENLFPSVTIDRAEEYKPDFIDITIKSGRVRGVNQASEPVKSVNKDEKRNLCNWLCENGSEDDFRHFEIVFDIISDSLDLQEE